MPLISMVHPKSSDEYLQSHSKALQIWIRGGAVQEKDVNAVIGKKIRLQRSLKGYSQATLAKMLGVTFQQVQKYEKGSNNVAPAKLLQLSLIFDCGVADLFPPSIAGREASAFIPSRRALHLIQNFERIGSEAVRKQICDLVRVIADGG